MLIALIVLPLFTPPVIFGAGAIDAFAAGLDWRTPLLLLAAYSLAAAALCPFAMAAACRNALSVSRPPMIAALANPERFMAFSRWAAPLLGVIALGCWPPPASPRLRRPARLPAGLHRPHHVHPCAGRLIMSEFVYACLGVASFLSLVFRHALADAAARAAAPLGAALTLLALVTGSLWGKPTWGTWWVWDPRLTSVLVLFLFYLGYMALDAAIEDEAKAARAAAILALVGLVNLPIMHFSVVWWNSLHQGSSLFRAGGPAMPPVYLSPLLIMMLAYMAGFGALWLVRIRAEVWRRRAAVLALRAAGLSACSTSTPASTPPSSGPPTRSRRWSSLVLVSTAWCARGAGGAPPSGQSRRSRR